MFHTTRNRQLWFNFDFFKLQNPMAMQAGPSSSVETQYPQEYYNPPAYLPHYNQHSGIHSVRKM